MLMTWFLSHMVLLLGFLLAVPVIAQIFRQRRSPARSLAWLLIMVLMPYFGIPLYMLLGGCKMRRLAESKTDIQLQDCRPGVGTVGAVRDLSEGVARMLAPML